MGNFLDHGHLIKVKPIKLTLTHSFTLHQALAGILTAAKPQKPPQVVWRMVYDMHRTDNYYHQPLSYVNQCICIDKYVSSAAFCTVTSTLLFGGGEGIAPR